MNSKSFFAKAMISPFNPSKIHKAVGLKKRYVLYTVDKTGTPRYALALGWTDKDIDAYQFYTFKAASDFNIAKGLGASVKQIWI